MKKLILFLFLALLSGNAIFAQISEGTLMLGGSMGLNSQTIQPADGSVFNVSIMPMVGYNISDNFLIGGQIRLESAFYDGESETVAQVTPLVRYFFNPSSEGNIYFGQLSAAFEIGEDPINIYTAGVGVNRFLNSSVALEGGLQYNLVTIDGVDENETVVLLNLGLQAFFSRELRANRKSATPGIGKGSVMLGTSSALVAWADEVLILAATPNAAYFVSDQLAVGAGLPLQLSFATDDSDQTMSTLEINPFARYYLPFGERCRYFGQLGLGIGRSKTSTGDISDITTEIFNFNAIVGTDVFLTPDLALELGLQFSSRYTGTEFESDFFGPNKSISRLYTFGLNVGIQYFWTRGSDDE
ncbi:MAG: hypothetical protein MRY78_09100 [Saprospiraceae bacterium]|nr:hypothetical protein [Saprospiraceae bacterium]